MSYPPPTTLPTIAECCAFYGIDEIVYYQKIEICLIETGVQIKSSSLPR